MTDQIAQLEARRTALINAIQPPYIDSEGRPRNYASLLTPYEYYKFSQGPFIEPEESDFPRYRNADGMQFSTAPLSFMLWLYISNIWSQTFCKDADVTDVVQVDYPTGGYSMFVEREEEIA